MLLKPSMSVCRVRERVILISSQTVYAKMPYLMHIKLNRRKPHAFLAFTLVIPLNSSPPFSLSSQRAFAQETTLKIAQLLSTSAIIGFLHLFFLFPTSFFILRCAFGLRDKMVRPPCCEKLALKRGLWTAEEDAKILAHVLKYGTGNWTAVPKKAG